MTCWTGSGLSSAMSVSSRVCHSASRAKLRPQVRTRAACRSGLRMPSFIRSWVYSSACTSAWVNATASSGWCAKPSSRHSSCRHLERHAGLLADLDPGQRRGVAEEVPLDGVERLREVDVVVVVHLRTCCGNRSAAVFSSASWKIGISTFSRSSCSLVKWISSSGVRATMVAVRSEWLQDRRLADDVAGAELGDLVAVGADRDLAVQDDVGLVGAGRLRDRRPALGQRHAGAGRTDEGDLLGCEHREEGVCHGQPFGLGPSRATSQRL